MNVFLSHVSEEGLLALVLKEWIQTSLYKRMTSRKKKKGAKKNIKKRARVFEVFVSGDIQNIGPGQKWLDVLAKALSRTRVLIVLASPNSVTRPWVNFEMGSAWEKKIPIVPICHSGQKLDNLPSPLSSFQGLDIHAPKFPDLLLQSLAKIAKLQRRPKLTPKRKRRMQREIKSALRKLRITASTRTTKPYQDKVLVILKKIAASNDRDCTWRKLAKSLNMDANDLYVYLRHMVDRKLLSTTVINGNKQIYTTTRSGREYIVQHESG